MRALWISLPGPRVVVAAVLGAAVILTLAVVGWLWYSATQRHVAEAYAAVLTRVEAARVPQASPEAKAIAARELEAIIARFPSAPAVARAAIELGDLRYEARQYAQARAAYEVALARSGGPTIQSLARASIASSREAERDWSKAIQAYQAALVGRGPKDFLYEDSMLDLARVQALAGRQGDASETYRRLLKELPGTRYADEVKTRLADLSAAPVAK